jgi:hypothetical protein
MVPVEPISLTIGIAPLFSTCIECFDYFKAGQEIEEDLEIILTKLDIEKTRLLMWGNGVGVLTDLPGDRAVGLSDEVKAKSIKGCLKCINTLLSGAENLRKEYGLQNLQPADTKRGQTVDFVSKNSMRIFQTSKLRFWVKHKAKPEEFGILSKTKWAIHSKEKFEGLIIHLREFIDGLYQVVPVGRESQDRLIEGDIASILDINKLRIVKSACDEASYRTWSDMASVVIEQSVSGTIDRRNFEERMQDIEETGDAVKNSMNDEEAPRDLTISKLLLIHVHTPRSLSTHRAVQARICEIQYIFCSCRAMLKFILEHTLPAGEGWENDIRRSLCPCSDRRIPSQPAVGRWEAFSEQRA